MTHQTDVNDLLGELADAGDRYGPDWLAIFAFPRYAQVIEYAHKVQERFPSWIFNKARLTFVNRTGARLRLAHVESRDDVDKLAGYAVQQMVLHGAAMMDHAPRLSALVRSHIEGVPTIPIKYAEF